MDCEKVFFNFLETFFPGKKIPDSLVEMVVKNAVIRSYEKRQFVIEQGEGQTALYFLRSGSLRCYSIKPDGNELTNNLFYTPGSPLIAAASLKAGVPAVDTIQALENTSLYLIPLRTLQAAEKQYPQITEIFSRTIGESFHEYVRLMKVRSLKPQDRYEWLQEQYPEMEQHIQKQYIASFLDMDKAVYSRCQKAYRETKRNM